MRKLNDERKICAEIKEENRLIQCMPFVYSIEWQCLKLNAKKMQILLRFANCIIC